ncbi:MAG: hypothetical protein KF678_02255 [Phycisphaeraceae bacterium]|nr:hypothetical protein [Phycisphaeraceae bacterium]
MVGQAALSSSLVLHINARLRSFPTPAFDNASTTYCEFVKFLYKTDPPNPAHESPDWHVAANGADEWLRSLTGVRRALLAWEPSGDARLSDRMSSAFVGGGGHWFVCLDRGEFDCWEGWWRMGDPKAADRRIWQVHYARVVESYPMEAEQLSELTAPVAEAAQALRSAVERARAFASRRSLDGFVACFDRAFACLDRSRPAPDPFHTDVAPPGALPDEATRLLAACQHAWVFGGMGSWNDLGIQGEGKSEYEAASDALFSQINRSICIATNASAPAV